MHRRNVQAVLSAVAVAAVVMTIALVVNHRSDSPTPAHDLAVGSGDSTGAGGAEPGNVGGGVPGDLGSGRADVPADEKPLLVPPVGDDGPPAQPPADGGSDIRTIAIADAHVNGSGDLVVGYYVGVPTCYGQLGQVSIDQRADSVTVTLTQAPDPTANDTPCIDIAMAKSAVVGLDRPLGGRTLLDGSTGEPVPVT